MRVHLAVGSVTRRQSRSRCLPRAPRARTPEPSRRPEAGGRDVRSPQQLPPPRVRPHGRRGTVRPRVPRPTASGRLNSARGPFTPAGDRRAGDRGRPNKVPNMSTSALWTTGRRCRWPRFGFCGVRRDANRGAARTRDTGRIVPPTGETLQVVVPSSSDVATRMPIRNVRHSECHSVEANRHLASRERQRPEDKFLPLQDFLRSLTLPARQSSCAWRLNRTAFAPFPKRMSPILRRFAGTRPGVNQDRSRTPLSVGC
jgi:hypothetical protein